MIIQNQTMNKIISLIFCLLLLTNCSASKQSYIGATSVATVSGLACYEFISENPAVVAACAVSGSFKGADIMYKENDDQIMTKAFIDHLENAPNSPGFTTWQNPKTQSNGIIKTTGFYLKGPIKCTMIETTHDQNLDINFDNLLLAYQSPVPVDHFYKVVFGKTLAEYEHDKRLAELTEKQKEKEEEKRLKEKEIEGVKEVTFN